MLVQAKLIPRNSFPAPSHTLSIPATFASLSYFTLHRPWILRKLRCWEAMATRGLGFLLPPWKTHQTSLQKQRHASITLGRRLVALTGGVMWQLLLGIEQQALTNELSLRVSQNPRNLENVDIRPATVYLVQPTGMSLLNNDASLPSCSISHKETAFIGVKLNLRLKGNIPAR